MKILSLTGLQATKSETLCLKYRNILILIFYLNIAGKAMAILP